MKPFVSLPGLVLVLAALAAWISGCPDSGRAPDAGVDAAVDADGLDGGDLDDGDQDPGDSDGQELDGDATDGDAADGDAADGDATDGDSGGDLDQTFSLTPSWALSGGGALWDTISSVDHLVDGSAVLAGSFAGEALVEGFSLSGVGWEDVFVARVSEVGQVLWTKTVGGAHEDVCARISACQEGHLVLSGSVLGLVDFETSDGVVSVAAGSGSNSFSWVLDSDGNGLEVEHEGDFLPISGLGSSCDRTQVTNHAAAERGESDAWGVCTLYDGSGEMQHQSWDAGTWGWVKPLAYDRHPTGKSATCGIFMGATDFGMGDDEQITLYSGLDIEMFLAQRGSGCVLEWVQATYSSAGFARGTALSYGPDGQIAVAGALVGSSTFARDQPQEVTLSSQGSSDAFVALYSSAGTLEWVVRLGGLGADGGTGVAVTQDGRVVLSGVFSDTISLDTAQGEQIDLHSLGGLDGFLVAFSLEGTPLAATSFGGPGLDQPTCLSSLGSNILVGGKFDNEISFGPGSPSQFTKTSQGDQDFFLASFDLVESSK